MMRWKPSVMGAVALALILSTGGCSWPGPSPRPGPSSPPASTSPRPSVSVSSPSNPALRQTLLSERPVAQPGTIGSSATSPNTAPLVYGGGPLLQALVPVVIDWGTGPATDLQQYVDWLLQPSVPKGASLCTVKGPGGRLIRQPCPAIPSPYLSLLSEYNVGEVQGGVFGGPSGFQQVHISNANEPNADTQHVFQRPIVTDATLDSELADWVAQGIVPTRVSDATENDPKVLYIILVDPAWDVLLTPESTRDPFTPEEPSDCDSVGSFDGFHAWDYLVPGGAALAIIPLCRPETDLTGTSTKSLEDFSATLSHELAEAVTDPYIGDGWTGYGGWPSANDDPSAQDEVDDYCTGDPSGGTFNLDGHIVSKFWSDKLGHCYGD